jgi:hypothetical protein
MSAPTSQFELPTQFAYIETSLPAGMTIDEYRRSRPRRPSWWRRLGDRTRRS